jgi:hypothetical protein
VSVVDLDNDHEMVSAQQAMELEGMEDEEEAAQLAAALAASALELVESQGE